VRIKICGITCVEDAVVAAEAGADALGLNFVGGPRRIGLETAEAILTSMPPFVTPVALVQLQGGAVPDDLLELLGQHWVSHVQVYGDYEPEHLALLMRDGLRPMVVVSVRGPDFADHTDPWRGAQGDSAATAVVLDAYDPQRAGGTGRTFRWDWVAAARKAGRLAGWPPIMLAGGLEPENVADAVRAVRP